MKLAFIDCIGWEYDVATPYERPLGGSQSAMCYLAVELAARGHEVCVYTFVKQPREFRNVKCRPGAVLKRSELSDCDAIVFLNHPVGCHALRPQMPPRCKILLWLQHAYDQPAIESLKSAEVQSACDRIVCVSQWHCRTTQQHFAIAPDRMAVMRNAIAPAFMNLFPDAAALEKAKSAAPLLVYTSTPFRGLNVLLKLFPAIRQLEPRAALRVYSSLMVYGGQEVDPQFQPLYDECRQMNGAEYVGSVPQPALAEALKSATILAYPNTFPETSCIAVMEALAAGLLVVTSDLAALPETTMGMGILVPPPGDLMLFTNQFAKAVYDNLHNRSWPARWRQVQAVNAQHTWPVRAAEWETFLGKCLV